MFFVACVSLMGIVIHFLTIIYLVNNALSKDSGISEALLEYLLKNSTYYLGMVAFSAFTFFIFSLFASLFFSHKIAGPLYRLSIFLRDNTNAEEKVSKLFFRKGDFFQEIPEKVNLFLKAKKMYKD